jgi:hypothetical protein
MRMEFEARTEIRADDKPWIEQHLPAMCACKNSCALGLRFRCSELRGKAVMDPAVRRDHATRG